MGLEGLGVGLPQVVQAGQGVKIAVVALAFAKGDMDIDAQSIGQVPTPPKEVLSQL